MSGTYDFIDQAADTLEQGNHAFVLVAINANDPALDWRYSIRSGGGSLKDMERLKQIIAHKLPEHFADVEREQGE